jgi:hypothetical protein
MKANCRLNNEDGSVLIMALMMLVLLTLIGLSATTTSQIETRISGNERVYMENLYAAEGGAMEGAQDMQGIPNPKNTPPVYLHPLGAVSDADILSQAFWESAAPVNSQVSAIADTRLLASSEGYARGKRGSSLDMGKAKVHSYLVFGRCERDNSGPVIVEIGYRKAF